MPLFRREIHKLEVAGQPAVGAVGRGHDVLVGFRTDAEINAVSASELRCASGIAVGIFPSGTILGAEPAELSLLDGLNVVLASYGGETPQAVADWLDWHARRAGATGALIYVGQGVDADGVATAIVTQAEAMTVVLVEGDSDLTEENLALYEVLRHRFLGQARAVLALSIADLATAEGPRSPFDRVVASKGVLALEGSEIFPWRLRRGKPAHHGDHVAVRKNGRRRLSSWGVVPGACPDEAIWGPDRIAGMAVHQAAPSLFRRAVGVANPGVTVGKLVRKSELLEDPVLARDMVGFFGPTERTARMAQRPSVEPGSVTVVTAMKNEGPFVLDWIAHHRVVGVSRFLVYTNDCGDGTDRLLDLLGDAGVLRRDNPFRETGRVPQYAAFRAAECEAVVRDADWLLTLDVDEYLNIHAGEGRISDLLARVPGAGAISIPWRLFGNAHRHRFEDRPVTHQFPLAAPDYMPRPAQAWAFKTIYRNDGTFRRLGVHRPKHLAPGRAAGLDWFDGSGRAFPPHLWTGGWRMTLATWGYDLAAVNHYAVRSAESFLVKRDRGRVNHVGSDQGTAYWFRMNHNLVEEHSIRRLDLEVEAERARLLALPGVAEAHGAAVDWHRERIAHLRREPEMAALFAQLTGQRLEKLSRMTPNFGMAVFHKGPEVIPAAVLDRDPGDRFYFTV